MNHDIRRVIIDCGVYSNDEMQQILTISALLSRAAAETCMCPGKLFSHFCVEHIGTLTHFEGCSGVSEETRRAVCIAHIGVCWCAQATLQCQTV